VPQWETGHQNKNLWEKQAGDTQFEKSTLVIRPSLIWSTVLVKGLIELWLTVSYKKA